MNARFNHDGSRPLMDLFSLLKAFLKFTSKGCPVHRVVVVPLLAVMIPLHAGSTWPKIPSEVWAMKEDPSKEIVGAVVLEDRLILNNTSTKYIYRVRILSDKGRKAAQLPAFSKYVHDIQGHTIYPDGREVTFNKEKDFTSSEISNQTGLSVRSAMVIPPGVNGNCVVEVEWTESGTPSFGPLPPDSYRSKTWGLGNTYKTLVTTVEIPISYPFAWTLSAGSNTAPRQVEKGGMKSFVWENLPPFELPPYALEPTMPRPRVFAYYQNNDLRDSAKIGPDKYWSVVANSYVMWFFDRNIDKGKPFKTFTAEALSQFPADAAPHSKASKLLDFLFRKIRNLNQLTFQEQAGMTSKQLEREVKEGDLEETVLRGETNSDGIMILYFHLLKAAGLEPKIAATRDRDYGFFDFNATNHYQISKWLVGIDEGPTTFWYDPSVRFGTPGVIPGELQGTPALIINPKTWTVSKGTIPIQAASVNQRRFSYQINLGEEEEVFQVKGIFSGIPEHATRSLYLKLEPKEQSKKLKESYEKSIAGSSVQTAELFDVINPSNPLSFQVKGRIEHDSGRKLEVEPFPGLSLPLEVPDQLPESRSLPIILPYLSIQVADSLIQLPKGYRFGGIPAIQHRNQFGMVTWSATPIEKDGTSQVRCTYRVDVNTSAANPAAYADFKTFLAWISEAGRRTLVLEKVR